MLFFLIQPYHGLKSCPSLLENISLHAPSCSVWNFSMFSLSTSVKHTPPAHCAQGANVVGKYANIFQLKPVSNIFYHFHWLSLTPSYGLLPYLPIINGFNAFKGRQNYKHWGVKRGRRVWLTTLPPSLSRLSR
jgi:hypothetical protein